MTKMNLGGLSNFAKALSGGHRVRVGIFGNKAQRSALGEKKKAGGHRVLKGTEANLTNAELGAIHEFGSFSRGIPPRSFLRMPILTHASEIMSEAKKGAMAEALKGNFLGMFNRMGRAAHEVVQNAFSSRGFGQWQSLKRATIRRKGSDAPLIDTGQLRRAMNWQVI